MVMASAANREELLDEGNFFVVDATACFPARTQLDQVLWFYDTNLFPSQIVAVDLIPSNLALSRC